MKKLIFSSLFMLLGLTSVSAQSALQNEILEVANRTNNYFMTKYSDPTLDTFVKKIRTSNLWTRAVYYEGLMALYEIDPQQRYLDYTDKWADYHKWTARGSVKDTDADNQCCQQTYIDRYVQTGGKKDLSKVKENLDHQMGTNRVNYWTWIDAIQMAMPAYAKYAKITGERKYLDYAMNSYKWSRDTLANGLFNKKEGLWWRDKDYVPPYKEKDGSNCYWSRGNGWVYAALVRVMETLPKKDKYYQYLKKDFILMSKAILKCQREDGYWNVSLVCPANYGGPEMTGTGLFSMVWHGVFSRAFFLEPSIRRRWTRHGRLLPHRFTRMVSSATTREQERILQPVSLSPSPLSQTSRTTAQVASCSVLQSITSF